MVRALGSDPSCRGFKSRIESQLERSNGTGAALRMQWAKAQAGLIPAPGQRREEAGASPLAPAARAGRRKTVPGGGLRSPPEAVEAGRSPEAGAARNVALRREETAAMRSQANTAKILENNPTLMRLRELEVIEKVAGQGKMNVVLGEKGLADRVVNLL